MTKLTTLPGFSVTIARILSTTLTVAAVAMVGLLVRREFLPSTSAPPVSRRAATLVVDSGAIEREGQPLRHGAHAVTITVLSDLECTACAAFDTTLDSVARFYGDSVNVVFVHYPLAKHRFAFQAAVAAECAGDAGRFFQATRAIFRKQDSIGLRPWTQYALDAGVTDTVSFAACVRADVHRARVERNRDIAVRLKATSTPTILVNGWRLSFVPGVDDLIEAVGAVRRGKAPFADLSEGPLPIWPMSPAGVVLQ